MDTVLHHLVVSLCMFCIFMLPEIPYLVAYLKSKSSHKPAALSWDFLQRKEVQEAQRMIWDGVEWMLDEQTLF